MLAVFLILGIGVTVQEMPAAPAGKDIGVQIGVQIVTGLVLGIVSLVIPAAVILLFGGVYYVTGRKDGVTFREAIFNWPMVILEGVVAFVSLL